MNVADAASDTPASRPHHFVARRWPALLCRTRSPEPLPVTLDRRRVYILPTGFGAGFAVILLVMLFGALNYSNNAALLLTCLLGATGAGSMFSTFRNLHAVVLQSAKADPVNAGDPLSLTLALHAPAHTRAALRIAAGERHTAVTVAHDQPSNVAIALPTTRRGWMPLPALRIMTTWPFGLFRAWSWVHPDTRVLVYPRPEASGPAPHGAAHGQDRPLMRHSGDDLAALRDYHAGDPVKLIAWKASARHDGLLVRELERPTSQYTWSLDWQATAGLEHEARIARLARWVAEANASHTRWTLRLPNLTLGPDAGNAHYHQCLRALALLP